ncbi:MAG TPA: POTRA domain-containing protein [Chryseosolibacter sp.]|nr:POTRA domain-containing protein [Chryseosolibacter sp.]
MSSPVVAHDSAEQQYNRADTVRTGKFVQINRIFITGNRVTRDKIILRELSLKTGDVVFTEDLPEILERDRKKLLNTRLFNTVEIRTLELEPARFDVIVDLNERWYTFPAPILELADRNFNEWWQNYGHDFKRLNYGLRLYQYNVRGRNETLRLHAQLGFQRKLELMYRLPYIDKKQKHGLSIDMLYTETKNLAYKTFEHKYVFLKSDNILRLNRGAGVSYSYRNSFYQIHSLRLDYYHVHVSDTVKELNPYYLKGESQDQKFSSITYGFNSDHRDLVSYPLKGHQITGTISRQGLMRKDDLKKTEALLVYSQFFDLKKKFYLSNNLVGYWSDPRDLSYANYGVLGFRRQFVRGYEIYVVEGPYFALNKTTFKKLIFSRKYHWMSMPLEQFRHIPLSIYLKTYADFGYVKNYPDYESQQINTAFSNKLLSGAGFGFDVVGSYDIVFRFEYTFNAEGQNGFFFHIKREF